MMRRLIVAAMAALSTSHAKAAAFSGTAAASAAMASQSDPWPWVVSAAGAMIVMIKLPSTGRAQGAANGLISVMLGGLGSAFAVEHLGQYIDPAPDRLLAAFLLSAAWPMGMAMIQAWWPALRKRGEQKISGEQ
jgi:hypothetical protein